MRGREDVDLHAIESIIDNCKASDAQDCRRLLSIQKYHIIDTIFSKMYDADGEENDFIPAGCSYDQLQEIVIKEGGCKESLNKKSERRIKREIQDYNRKIQDAKAELENISTKCILKQQELYKIQTSINQRSTELFNIDSKIKEGITSIRILLRKHKKDGSMIECQILLPW